MRTIALILCEVLALVQCAGVTLPETCRDTTNKKPKDVAYADLWTPGLLIHAPSGCARPQKRCGDGYQPSGVPETPIPHVMLSGRGKWYWVGPDCNSKPVGLESFLNPIYEGHTFHLVDEGIVVAERTVQKDELFIQALPCHKKTVDINCARDFVGKTPSIGMHVLCFLKNRDRVCAYRDGSGVCELLEGEDLTTVEHIAYAMGLEPRKDGQNPMRFYTLDGKWVATSQGHFALLLFENGVWMWPPMEMNYSRKVSLTDRDVHIVTRSTTPAIFEVMETMIDDNEIDQILELADTRLVPSTIGYGSQATPDSKIRTSSGTFIHPRLLDDELFKFFVRAQSLMRVPLTQTEHIQVVKYEPSQFYVAHSDVAENNKEGIKQKRMATLFTNFKDVEKGGATGFPYARTTPKVKNPECAILEMPAYKGKSIFWYNTHANGAISYAANHMGCKVEIGEKIASNFWFWDGPINKRDENLWMHDDRTLKASTTHFNDADIAFFAK